MANDWFEQLAHQEIPPPPRELDLAVHRRVNRSLLGLQLLEVVVKVLPLAAFHFGVAMLAAIGYSLFGPFRGRRP